MTLIETIAKRETAFTVPEIAKLLHLSPRCVYEHVSEGRLPCIKIGTTIRLDPKVTAAWLSGRAA
jgi:excisionase family DNA binding protein